MNQIETINISKLLNNKVTVPAHLMQSWQYYLAKNTDPLLYSITQKSQIALAEKFYSLEYQGRTLYHMSITYKPFGGRLYTEKDVNTFYINFYTKEFLPHLMGTRNYTTSRMKSLQPITFCFVDEHSHKAIKVDKGEGYTFPDRLHHHAILALDESTVKQMNYLLYENSLANTGFTYKIMTSDIKQCEAQTVLYASKMLKKYPDFMSFPDTFKRHRRKHVLKNIPKMSVQLKRILHGR